MFVTSITAFSCLLSIDIIIGCTFLPWNHSLAIVADIFAAVSGYKSSKDKQNINDFYITIIHIACPMGNSHNEIVLKDENGDLS